ncbi:hypothetical protein [Bradyrhizobium sp. Ai1a-2]|uniref:hypothetical protein n=1 Tax=Bradyrhizobium sp. Ai1a-2 TaxID=196490 RepID=UPI000408D569|nr:hypothetical protein [Bradyrhizobium sp. Ai1a-2]
MPPLLILNWGYLNSFVPGASNSKTTKAIDAHLTPEEMAELDTVSALRCKLTHAGGETRPTFPCLA